MCGIAGFWSQGGSAKPLLAALAALQHRGQDGAGVLLAEGNSSDLYRAQGMLAEALPLQTLAQASAAVGLGHLRYATSGSGSENSAALQPLLSEFAVSQTSLALVHNGNLTDLEPLRAQLGYQGALVSDTALLLERLAETLITDAGPAALLDSAERALDVVRGAYAAVAWLPGQLLAFRDPLGIRPLQLGQRQGSAGIEWLLASESVALEAAGFSFVRDLNPGELLLIDSDGRLHSRMLPHAGALTPSVFEYVYFAAAQSRLDGIGVAELRRALGQRLAKQLTAINLQDALVVPVPSTSRPAAQGLAEALELPYVELIEKRPFAGRSFILASKGERCERVQTKFSFDPAALAGRHLLLVDDSIVRGTTLRYLVRALRSAGVGRITLCSAAPAVRYSDCYGIDLPDRNELIAHGRSEAEIADLLDADQLFYLPKTELIAALRQQNPAIEHFECALFDGKYVAGFQNKAEADRLLSATRSIAQFPQAVPA